jgi:hypothetical protein
MAIFKAAKHLIYFETWRLEVYNKRKQSKLLSYTKIFYARILCFYLLAGGGQCLGVGHGAGAFAL